MGKCAILGQDVEHAPREAGMLGLDAEPFDQFDMDDTLSTLDMSFLGERLPPLTRDAESWGGFRDRDACA